MPLVFLDITYFHSGKGPGRNSVVGKDRLPTFDDRDALPYIEATICETLTLRFRNPSVPLG